jgi:hypothetical protein
MYREECCPKVQPTTSCQSFSRLKSYAFADQLVSLRDHLIGEVDISSKKQKSLRVKLQESINVADLLAGRYESRFCYELVVSQFLSFAAATLELWLLMQ